jgi:hypothetical protein
MRPSQVERAIFHNVSTPTVQRYSEVGKVVVVVVVTVGVLVVVAAKAREHESHCKFCMSITSHH